MNKPELKKLKRKLKKIKGFRQKIKDRSGFSLKYIDYVLSPTDNRHNSEIIDAAFEVLKEETERIAAQKELLK